MGTEALLVSIGVFPGAEQLACQPAGPLGLLGGELFLGGQLVAHLPGLVHQELLVLFQLLHFLTQLVRRLLLRLLFRLVLGGELFNIGQHIGLFEAAYHRCFEFSRFLLL